MKSIPRRTELESIEIDAIEFKANQILKVLKDKNISDEQRTHYIYNYAENIVKLTKFIIDLTNISNTGDKLITMKKILSLIGFIIGFICGFIIAQYL